MRYSLFTVEDFCRDPDFIQWVISPTHQSTAFWEEFVNAHPYKRLEVEQAISYIRAMQLSEIEPDPERLNELRTRIWEQVDQESINVYRSSNRVYLAAASLVFALLGGLWWFTQSTTTFHTSYGEKQEILLADGSKVTLNAQSEIKVSKNLANKPIREVWLKGEAYFEIAKRSNTKFIVHTPETHIEVLGTMFNVNTRREKTSVVLTEGKVQLMNEADHPWVMKPGQMAIVDKNKAILSHNVIPEHYHSWKESYLIMEDKPVVEIVDMVKDTYGIQIQFQDSSLLKKRLSGKLATDRSEQFLENLSTILECDLVKQGNGYEFR